MFRGYIRPEPKFPAKAQREALRHFGVQDGAIYEEAERGRGDTYPELADLTGSLRQGDSVVVTEFHRLASNLDDLRENATAILSRGFEVLETTGRRSGVHIDLVHMVLDAVLLYGRKLLSHAQAVELGKLGAAASPMTKRKRGRMPIAEAKVLWVSRPDWTSEQALALINSDRRYRVPYSMKYAYAKLGPRRVKAGPKG